MSDERDPHQEDEDPMDNIGEELPDPWADESAKDWPDEEVEPE